MSEQYYVIKREKCESDVHRHFTPYVLTICERCDTITGDIETRVPLVEALRELKVRMEDDDVVHPVFATTRTI